VRTGICIIGAGPAGLMAAIHAARAGAPTAILEGNAGPGRKLLLTGGGHCNFTHAGAPEEIARAFGKAGRFLRHSLYELSPDDVREFFRARGLASRVEPDGCVFPTGDKAADVLGVLARESQQAGVHFLYHSRVTDLAADPTGFQIQAGESHVVARCAIIATGGVSWPQTGSTGDGYTLAARLGHTITPPRPSLVPLVTRERWVRDLAGVSLAGVRIWATVEGRKVTAAGDMLFTHSGIGGPAVLDLSRFLADALHDEKDPAIPVGIDMLSGTDEAGLDGQIQWRIQAHPRKAVANVLSEFVPRQLAQTLCRIARCDCDLQVGQLPAEKRRRLVALIKRLPLCVIAAEPIARATVTRGGVSLQEIDPRTLESRLRAGLFFAGEVIDVDGPCGGYNLQACWSTGALAGRSAAMSHQRGP
jgi:predicted Rossmann fold flavoprotein